MSCTTRDILDKIKLFHKMIGDLYEEISNETERPRVKMMMDYLVDHEKELGDSINEFEKSSSTDILNFNFKYTPDTSLDHFFEGIDFSPSMSLSDVLNIVLDFNDRLIVIYEQLAAEAESKDVTELFKSLAKMEERDRRVTVRNSLELEGI